MYAIEINSDFREQQFFMDTILLISVMGFVILLGLTLFIVEEFTAERRVIMAEYRRRGKNLQTSS